MIRKYSHDAIFRKLYLYIYIKYCKIFHRKFIKEYIAIFKYKNKIDYFINATGINKKDCREKVRTIVFHSNFFNDVKDKNDIQVIVMDKEENDNE